MGDSEKDASRESTPIRDSVPVTSRILEMQPDAFAGRENLVAQQKQDMQYQKRMDRPTGPISRLLGKPFLVDDQAAAKPLNSAKEQAQPRSWAESTAETNKEAETVKTDKVAQSDKGASSDSVICSWDPIPQKWLPTNFRKPDGIASFDELYPGCKDEGYRAMLEKIYPKGIPYRVMPSGRRLPWSGIQKTLPESPTFGSEFEPQIPTTNTAVRG